MKREIAITGFALIISILLSAPSLAQTQPASHAKPAPPTVEAGTNAENVLSLDELVQGDFAPEDRAGMLMRCIGPPPRPLHSTQAERHPPSEPAVAADAPTALRS